MNILFAPLNAVIQIGIISLLLPVLFLVGITYAMIKRKNVLFRQNRVGLNGKKFVLYKFKTMDNGDFHENLKADEEEKVVKGSVEHFMRVTHLDELPQIINIIKGDMALIGPRPDMAFIVDKYDKLSFRRLCVKPGLTGVWQLFGDEYEFIYKQLKYDLYYIKKKSPILDLWIIYRTILKVTRKIYGFIVSNLFGIKGKRGKVIL